MEAERKKGRVRDEMIKELRSDKLSSAGTSGSLGGTRLKAEKDVQSGKIILD